MSIEQSKTKTKRPSLDKNENLSESLSWMYRMDIILTKRCMIGDSATWITLTQCLNSWYFEIIDDMLQCFLDYQPLCLKVKNSITKKSVVKCILS